jgi:PRTRC genetic system ThiF family protein
MKKAPIHFTDNYLINPTNPVTINLIGAGGTGSAMISALGRIHTALLALDHPGFDVRLFDGDTVSETNLKRQLFASAEQGLSKSVCLINRINRFFGTDWKGYDFHYDNDNLYRVDHSPYANITISCVDKVAARFSIADILRHAPTTIYAPDKPLYWIDLGNNRYTGQLFLSTVGCIKQPASKKFQPISDLPLFTEQYGDVLQSSEEEDETPTCSAVEALTKQDLFINPILAQLCGKFLMDMIRQGYTDKRGFYLNIEDYNLQPMPLPKEALLSIATAA